MPDIRVAEHPQRPRYEIFVDDQRAGLVTYQLDQNVITFVHTEIDDAYAGQGLGGRLARFALDDARARGLRVVAQCPFIARFIEKHPEYSDLLARV